MRTGTDTDAHAHTHTERTDAHARTHKPLGPGEDLGEEARFRHKAEAEARGE